MSTERTFSIIKPDAVERNKIGEITAMLENAGLRVVASKRLKLDQANDDKFYEFKIRWRFLKCWLRGENFYLWLFKLKMM